MQAVVVQRFGERPVVGDHPDPTPPPDGAVVEVAATGVCRSDWHGWMGHDPDVVVPYVPGHEFAGTVVALGAAVSGWDLGARVTAPFVQACGRCDTCRAGDGQVCPHQTQPGFGRDGSFARFVVVERAATNLVALPDAVDDVAAASLGCRFATAYRAVVAHGRPRPGDWVAVHGCGGVGLAAVMVAVAHGARVVAVDVDPAARDRALELGAEAGLEPPAADDLRELTGGGAHVAVEALGRASTQADALAGLRRRGRLVQVGLLVADDAHPAVDMARVIGHELEIVGSHGMAAGAYPAMLAEIAAGGLDPARLVGRTVGLAEVPDVLAAFGGPPGGNTGVTVADLRSGP